LRLPLGNLGLLGTTVESSFSVVVFSASVVYYASVWLLGRSLSGGGAVAILVWNGITFSLARILRRVRLLLRLSDRILDSGIIASLYLSLATPIAS
jgi:hypothetical protein